MTATGNLLSLARAAQALVLVGENVKVAKQPLKKKVPAKKFLSLAIKNIVGTRLIRSQAQVSSGL